MADKMYLERTSQYHGGVFIAADNNEIYKGIYGPRFKRITACSY